MKRINTKEGPYFMQAIMRNSGLSLYISKSIDDRPSNFWYWVAAGRENITDFLREELNQMVERYEDYYDRIASIDY